MKTNFSISAESKLIDEFTSVAKELGTNRTHLITMMMTDVVKNPEFRVKRNHATIESISDNQMDNMFSNEEQGRLKRNTEEIFNNL
jgi:hypothetical protein